MDWGFVPAATVAIAMGVSEPVVKRHVDGAIAALRVVLEMDA